MADDNSDKNIDSLSGVATTGHEWDGITELNNPLPKWWLYTFYVTILWSVVYWILMPAWPLISTFPLIASRRSRLCCSMATSKENPALAA